MLVSNTHVKTLQPSLYSKREEESVIARGVEVKTPTYLGKLKCFFVVTILRLFRLV